MTGPRKLSCQTCGTTETHVPLSDAQKAWLRQEIGEPYVEEYFLCVRTRADGTGCRNLRTSWAKKRFRQPKRMPDDIE
ncbi:hypothetical protein [Streptomyces poonensis]|nr:hypothetical protein [Streptomyces poonensis]